MRRGAGGRFCPCASNVQWHVKIFQGAPAAEENHGSHSSRIFFVVLRTTDAHHIFFVHCHHEILYGHYQVFFLRMRPLTYSHEHVCIHFYHAHFWTNFYHDTFVINMPYLITSYFYNIYTICYQEHIQNNRVLSLLCPYNINFITAIVRIHNNFLDKSPQNRQRPV